VGADDLQGEIIKHVRGAFTRALDACASPIERVSMAFEAANGVLRELLNGPKKILYAGSGGEAVALAWGDEGVALGWVGRSGVHRIRSGQREPITRTHVLPDVPGVITRVLGHAEAEVLSIQVESGDVLELTSGGGDNGRAEVTF
jgi:hypothetical protein